MDETRLHESLDKSGKWMRHTIEQVSDVRQLSTTLIALTDSGDERFGHHIQRIATKLKNSQDHKKGRRHGSWNGELWDTALAIIALHRASMTPLTSNKSTSVKIGLEYIKKQWEETNLNNWWDYIPETIVSCKAIIEVQDKEQFEYVEQAIKWLIDRKCEDGSFASTKYTAQIISLLSYARDELHIDDNDEHIESGIEFLRVKINDQNIRIFNDPWLTSQIISALIDAGVEKNDPDIEKCCNALLKIQEEESEQVGSWFGSISRTANCMIAVSKVLGPLKLQKRKEDYWTRVKPRPGRLTWSWKAEGNSRDRKIGHGLTKIDVMSNEDIISIASIPQDQFDISLVEEVKKKLEKVSEISTNTSRKKRGSRQTTVQDTGNLENEKLSQEMKKAGKLLYDSILTMIGTKDTFEGKMAENKIGHLKISTEGDNRLNSIPWELIYVNGTFSCLNYALGRTIQSIPRSDDDIEEDRQFKILLVGDPTETLQGVNSELDALKRGLEIDGDDIFIKKIYGRNVTKENFFTEISDGGYDIIHFAGHADLIDNNSYLLFKSEGENKTVVGAQEIANRIENCRVKPKIVFMNACSSAAKSSNLNTDVLVYDKESSNIALDFVTELQRVNISAYIGAIWPIHDVQAAEFAIRFYKNIRKGCTIGDAVRLSRIDAYLEDPEELTWASFVLYGTPTMRIKLKKEIVDNETKNVNVPKEYTNNSNNLSEKIFEKANKAIELLSDPRFEFRKKKTLTKHSGMTEAEFEEFLKMYPQVRKSPIPAADGSEIYRLDKSMFKF